MDLVQNQRVDVCEAAPAPGGGQQDVQRFGGRDQDVGRLFRHFLPLGLRRIATAEPHTDLRKFANFLREEIQRWLPFPIDPFKSEAGGQGNDLLQRAGQVFLDVVGQRLEWGDVDHLIGVWQLSLDSLADQPVDAGQECGQSLAGARGRCNEGVLPFGHGCPALRLGLRGFTETLLKPLADDGMKMRR